jgi:hypothetical protein
MLDVEIYYEHIPDGDYCTINSVARELGAAHASIQLWCAEEKIPLRHIHKKAFLIEKKDAERLIRLKRDRQGPPEKQS